MEKTTVYETVEFNDALIEQTIIEVYNILKDRGYDPVNQLVGYLISGDPGYITSHKEARNKIVKFDRNKVLEVLVKRFCK